MNLILQCKITKIFLNFSYNKMTNIYNNTSWTFNKPSDNCAMTNTKFNELSTTPYNGIFVNKAFLQMPVIPSQHISKYAQAALSNITVPNNFSWRKNGVDQIEKGGVRNQFQCGSCWSFSVASVLGDRFALMNQLKSPYPSTVWLASQAENSDPPYNVPGCNGNNVYYFVKWLSENKIGVKLENCWPYKLISNSGQFGGPQLTENNLMSAPSSLNTPDLSNCCYNCCGSQIQDQSSILLFCKPEKDNTGTFNIKYFGLNIDSTNGDDYTQNDIDKIIKEIQIEILTNGPVSTSFMVYEDFMTYWKNDAPNGKIYSRNNNPDNNKNGGHAVVITGWGEQDGQKFWEIRNSWGDTGDNGYCKIAFSKLENKDYWVAIDVPILINGNYIGGVVSFLPDNSLSKINYNILLKSNAGNLLQKSRNLLQNNNNNTFNTLKNISSNNILDLIIIVVIIIIVIAISIYLVLFLKNVFNQKNKNHEKLY